MKNSYLALYTLLSIVNIAGNYFDISLASTVSKPLLMPLLVILTLTNSNIKRPVIQLLIGALTLSWIGDVVLMFQEYSDLYFMIGLGSFLIAHVLYCVLFVKALDRSKPNNLVRILSTIFVSVYLMTSMKLFLPLVGDMKIPVAAYSITISFMLAFALWRASRTSPKSYWLVAIGAVLFIASDSVLAFNKFINAVPAAGAWIMITYLSAQALITLGVVDHDKNY